VLLKTYSGPFLANLETFLGRVPAKIKKNAINFFCFFILKIIKTFFEKQNTSSPNKLSGESEYVFRLKKYSLDLELEAF
jgi:hypothetical protein